MGIQVIAFDVNGTLLDMGVMEGLFRRVFKGGGFRERWFGELQVMTMVTIPTLKFAAFDKLARAAMEVVAAKEGDVVEAVDLEAMEQQMLALPSFADVKEGLGRLKRGGYRLAA